MNWAKRSLEVFAVAYVLNYLWETWQLIFYTNDFVYALPQAIKTIPLIPAAIWDVSLQALTDAILILSGYLLISARSQKWTKKELLLLTGYCVTISIFSERIGLMQHWWVYSQYMPTILGIGIVPICAFLIIPTLCIKSTIRKK